MSCLTCELSARRAAGEAPPWDDIVRTSSWDVAHAFGTAVEGWLVLVARRHITAVAELTDAEATELGSLVRDTSRALREVLGCQKTYIAQFAEHQQHQHVHVHVVPRRVDLADEHRGPGVFALMGVPTDQCVPDARMEQIAAAVRQRMPK